MVFFASISPSVLPYLFVGSLFGLVVGIIPGLSGHFAIAMAIPFLYTMEPATGIAFLLAAHAAVAQGGGLTSILFSTPGTGQNAATLLDGPPMRNNGQAGVARWGCNDGLPDGCNFWVRYPCSIVACITTGCFIVWSS